MAEDDSLALVARLLERMAGRGWRLAAAESDTGGVLLDWLTAAPGSSRVVLGGVVAYHDHLKRSLLGVEPAVIERQGAVSAAVAEAMAEGMRRVAGADVALATTGISGPAGATAAKPVGLAYVAVATPAGTRSAEHRWQGDRAANRRANARAVVELALSLL
ncbi:MAG: nicotinamide-nucleotide amidohydrolase family protein [Chloroflexi bacterium]|nr:nicotinamide-nucleotide amidohydrolase family protein [Chloroflexota bacterium]